MAYIIIAISIKGHKNKIIITARRIYEFECEEIDYNNDAKTKTACFISLSPNKDVIFKII